MGCFKLEAYRNREERSFRGVWKKSDQEKGVANYYPFGLTFNSFKRENSVENRIRFQGQEHVDDLELNWDSFKWRNYQPDIGRFFNVDPLAEKYVHNSTYAFAENKVITFRELEGLEGVHYMEEGPNGKKREVIEKNVVVLLREKKAIPENATEKEKKKIERQNDRNGRWNANRLAMVTNDLNEKFNGNGGAKNSHGVDFFFKFNVIGVETKDTKGPSNSQQMKALAEKHGIMSSQKDPLTGDCLIAPAAIITTGSTKGNHGLSNGLWVTTDMKPGSTSHEVGHTLLRRSADIEDGYLKGNGLGGIMEKDPSNVSPKEVDLMFYDAYER